MTHVIAAILLLLITVGWFALAMLPALGEAIGRKDIEPLRLSPEAADIRFFAQSFRRYVNENFDRLRAAPTDKPCVTVQLERDVAWYASRASGTKTVFEGCDPSTPTDKLVAIAEGDVNVPDDTTISREIFAGGSLHGGTRTTFRAMLVEQDASLGDEATVFRWADAGNQLKVGTNSTLWGRASAGKTMVLAEGTRFERLAAPRMFFGATEASDAEERAAETRRLTQVQYTTFEPPDRATISEGRWALDGDLHIPEGNVVQSDLVLTGALTMGRGAKIDGAVRANTITTEDECVFSRSIVAEKFLAVGAHCHITGPIAVEGEAVFGDECRVGELGDETTISAITIRMGRAVELSGEIWARGLGIVMSPEMHDAQGAIGESEIGQHQTPTERARLR
ncbi:MAG TPA: hypothetical protein VGM82_16760 [Gemmatimonadaceae bacterium]|jgi:predicted acyltransferase (DUF342 family)